MKYLIAPAFAVVVSTVGCIYGCHAAGMPPDEVKIAGLLAGATSSVTAFGAVLIAGYSHRTRVRRTILLNR